MTKGEASILVKHPPPGGKIIVESAYEYAINDTEPKRVDSVRRKHTEPQVFIVVPIPLAESRTVNLSYGQPLLAMGYAIDYGKPVMATKLGWKLKRKNQPLNKVPCIKGDRHVFRDLQRATTYELHFGLLNDSGEIKNAAKTTIKVT